uniref:Acyl-CoA synthetase short-chain family member 3, mitochondrial n=1 Tax=Periophthalmus magnuspinnatus TaxID=409849 RepID=A0A3B3ZDC4_9GOBI
MHSSIKQFIRLQPCAHAHCRTAAGKLHMDLAQPRITRVCAAANTQRFVQQVSRKYTSDTAYDQAFSAARDSPQAFWREAGQNIHWFEPWTKTLHFEDPLNMCYNAVDRHVESGRGDQPAIIYDSPVTGTKQIISYRELQEQVSRLAGVLVKHGVQKGDLVVIYMPMVPQAMFTMLACARIGAPHSLIFGGFASRELAVRITHAKPKLMVTASFGIEPGRRVQYIPLVEKALDLSSHRPSKVLIFNRPNMERVSMNPELCLDWDEEMATAQPHDCVSVPSNHPLYVLYTSGTTGAPKGKPVGTPDPGAFFRVLSEHGASSMFTAPTAIRAIRQQDPDAAVGRKYSLSRLQTLFVAGERCDVETLEWAKKSFGVPILDHWWQTETGSPITSTCAGLGHCLTTPPGQAGKPVPGYDVRVIDDDMEEVNPRTLGNIVVRLPLPPGAALSLWQNQDLFKELYFTKFPGYYDTMDAGFKDEEGFIYIMSRSDDVINVAGHRLSAGALEESILQHPAVGDCAVVALEDALKGHVPLALCVLKNGEEEIVKEIVMHVRDTIGPVAAFRKVVFVQALPKTRSGKIPRSALAKLVSGKPYKITPTIEDPKVFKAIEKEVEKAPLGA